MNKQSMTVATYHQRSKHRLQQYASGPHGLDWATQPNPFREFVGCERKALPQSAQHVTTPFSGTYRYTQIPPALPDKIALGVLFELAMGLSAWKAYGSNRWALRNNPSSGNLHPTESYLITSGASSIDAGVYHYHSYLHALEQRCAFKSPAAGNALLIGLSSIHWREAWKYGERAYRYCQHDVGHAIAAFSYAAATLGWRVELLDHLSDEYISTLLGLNRSEDFSNAEHETADVLLQIHTAPLSVAVNAAALATLSQQGTWHGQANRLSPAAHIEWPVIEEIGQACIKPQTAAASWSPVALPTLLPCKTNAAAVTIIQQRRSAQAFDGVSTLPLHDFYRMLDCVLPRENTPPFDSLHWLPRIHLAIFIHRVGNLQPGLYVLARSAQGENILRENLSKDFDWIKPDSAAEHLALYQLANGDARQAARVVSCHQDIAADSAFSLGMLAEFDQHTKTTPWQYRQLFWEAGMIGQTLYLEAEAAGVRATGIGCYFDDSMHELLGIQNTTLQSLYHFTVGTAVTDERVMTELAYAHLNR